METMEAITKRSSVRAYDSEQLPDEDVENILLAGCAAPMGANKYDCLHLTVVQDPNVFDMLSDAMSQVLKKKIHTEKKVNLTLGAPTFIIISGKELHAEQPMPGMHYVNAGCVAENMMLAAADMGIGSCVVGTVGLAIESSTELRAELEIPKEFTPLFGIVFGYDANYDRAEKELSMTIGISRI